MHSRVTWPSATVLGLALASLLTDPAGAQTGGATSRQPAPLPDRPAHAATGAGGPTGTRNALGNGQTTGAGMTGTGMPGQGNLPAQPQGHRQSGHDTSDVARTGAAETTASTASTKR